MSDILQELEAVFESERQEHAEAIRNVLARAANDCVREDELSDAMRHAHSLKGAARAVGLGYIEAIAHEMENLLQSGTDLTPDVIRQIEQGLDDIDDWLSLPPGQRPDKPDQPALSHLGQPTSTKSSADEVGTPAEMKKRPPQPTAARSEPLCSGEDMHSGEDEVPALSQPRQQQVRVSVDSLESLLRAAGELQNDLNAFESNNTAFRMLCSELLAVKDTSGSSDQPRTAGPAPPPSNINISANGRGTLADTLKQITSTIQVQSDALRTFRHHLNELHDSVKEVRLTPASAVFKSFRKMARDIAETERKRVDFNIYGIDSSADRMILQRMKDAIMHLIRNAISHGIESPEERSAHGKPERGKVSLSLERVGETLKFSVEDDGRGLNLERIRKRAIAKQLIRPDQDCDEAMLAQLIFTPGFSTSHEVTEISGRGMGMSIVHEAVTELQGSVSVDYKGREGTAISVTVPAGFVVQPMVLFDWQGQGYAMPSRALTRLERITPEMVSTSAGAPIVTIGGNEYNLLSIGSLLGEKEISVNWESAYCLVLRWGTNKQALLADQPKGFQECLVYPPDFLGVDRSIWSGIIISGNGNLRLVVNFDSLLRSTTERASKTRLTDREVAAQIRRQRIMVVDDSITTRTLEKSILEARGYDVILTVDGRDALEKLVSDPPDLVVSDIEMPRMNGFELLTAIRSHESMSELPVILVTSLDREDHKEEGMRRGANAYVAKQRFDQRELLNAIERLI